MPMTHAHLCPAIILAQQVQQPSQAQRPLTQQLTQHQPQVMLSQEGGRLSICGWQQEEEECICSEGVAPVHLARPHDMEQVCEQVLDCLRVRFTRGLHQHIKHRFKLWMVQQA